MKFHDRLKELKDESGKKQSDIAEYVGVSPQVMSLYFNNREPGYDVLCKLAHYFGVSTDYLLGLTDVRSPDPNAQAAAAYTGLNGSAVNLLHEVISKDVPVGSNSSSFSFVSDIESDSFEFDPDNVDDPISYFSTRYVPVVLSWMLLRDEFWNTLLSMSLMLTVNKLALHDGKENVLFSKGNAVTSQVTLSAEEAEHFYSQRARDSFHEIVEHLRKFGQDEGGDPNAKT